LELSQGNFHCGFALGAWRECITAESLSRKDAPRCKESQKTNAGLAASMFPSPRSLLKIAQRFSAGVSRSALKSVKRTTDNMVIHELLEEFFVRFTDPTSYLRIPPINRWVIFIVISPNFQQRQSATIFAVMDKD
jgi:hypothetical protein